LNIPDRFSKNTQLSDCIKLRPVGADLFHAEGLTDGGRHRYHETNVHFPQFCECAQKFRVQKL